ncbi:hypothetical protein [Arcobacter sp. FWKO B]|uniref:hypothetical protein n=1 Tax=Arcobacter sp. FWKO B TaxID=2593672 RepID=UPI0018A5DA7B|nr:hypothetical protein [Arcobacter sp. FWKO B]QOG11239.1 hypothetical protein FWKOB_00395 [Arcobacter sp. FWKO B]
MINENKTLIRNIGINSTGLNILKISNNDEFIAKKYINLNFEKAIIFEDKIKIKPVNRIDELNTRDITKDSLIGFDNNNIKSKAKKVIIENCSFDELSVVSFPCAIEFINCKITKLSINRIFNNSNNIFYFDLQGGFIDYCYIEGDIKTKFYINKQDDNNTNQTKINKLEIRKANFEQNFKLHNCVVDEVLIKDVDFEKNADFYKSKFIKGMDTNDIYFKSINFKGLALFGDTEFFKKLIFKYVTFEGYNHFKSSKLHKGLDLEYTNVQKEINFYGMDILDKTTTSQETYRIIKNQFEKLNNKIEANKYHALELEQRKKELEKNKWQNFSEYLVFKIHSISSKHSTSYAIPLVWIFMVSLCTNYFLGNTMINFSSNGWNNIFKYINILSNIEAFNNSYITMTLNKVSLGYLYYQFVTAVRKDTRK